MRFTLRSLTLKGFRSFRKQSSFTFDDQGVLVLVTGKNLVEPRLGANGVGKSTLFEGLFWTLFGKTSVNLRASDVATWDGDEGAYGAVEFRLDDSEHVIERTWGPNSLTYDGKAVEQRELEQHLGWTPATFLYAVYHAQFVAHFADLEPSSQLEVYSELLRLNVWDAALDIVGERAKRDREDLAGAERSLAGAVAERRVLSERFDDECLEEARWLRRQSQAIRVARDAANVARSCLDRATKDLSTASRKVVDRSELKAARSAAGEASRYANNADSEVNQLKRCLRELEDRRDGLSREDVCPTCGQALRRQDVKAHFVREIRAVSEAIEAAERNAAGRHKAELAATAHVDKVEALFREQEDARSRSLGTLEEAVRAARRQSQNAETDLRDLWTERCPYDSSRVGSDLRQASERAEKLTAEVTRLRALAKAYEFWAAGFREIKLDLVARSIAQFEATTNAVLPVLGLEDWSIAYDVESETKTGKLRRGFTIYVQSPHNSSPVPFKAWSGGERQRLRLAVALGLSDLVQDCLGLYTNVEIFDEPTAWLAELGIDDLLECLAARARERETTLILADHRSLHSGQALRIVSVEKGPSGSYLAEA